MVCIVLVSIRGIVGWGLCGFQAGCEKKRACQIVTSGSVYFSYSFNPIYFYCSSKVQSHHHKDWNCQPCWLRRRYLAVQCLDSSLARSWAITLCSVVGELCHGWMMTVILFHYKLQPGHDLQFILVINYQGVAGLSIPSNYTENILASRSPVTTSSYQPASQWDIYQLDIRPE